MKIKIALALILGLLWIQVSKAEYPVLTSKNDQCLAEIRQSTFYGNGDANSYPVLSTGPVSAGQVWKGSEGGRICVRFASNCKTLPADFYCVGSMKGFSEGQPVNGEF
ncbi:hypothetical protein [Pseudomonas chlororaphis]|uniref:Uncharacterized protein n=1 Tax=Pseudomonas chlororaphis subsp. aurantiaca TaxID=86192 RepID=A0AAJ0ZJT4_9PSED|nr:hypothetical protein [Pseudomonas chlororaphis]MBU4634023.1 hypothetical protein [Pseudomonas chlororaphis subsp. aurantiaca]